VGAADRRIVLLLVLVGAFRLSLLGRGAMSFLDETWYYKSALALQLFQAGRPSAAFEQIASTNGRPGAAVVSLIPAAMQGIPFAFGVSPSNPWSLMIPTTLNVAVSLVTVFLFFRVCLELLAGDRWIAITAAAVYSLLVNTNMYVRHMLPYDWALAAAVYALWLAISRPSNARIAFRIGLLAGSVVAIYPGYYMLAGIPAVVMVSGDAPAGWTQRWRAAAGFAAGAVTVVGAFECVCRLGGISYVGSVMTLGRTITQGSFDEGWVFLPTYMIQVERYTGAALLVGTAAYVARAGSAIARGEFPRRIDWLILPALTAWLYQAVGSAQGHTMVLYGRLIHPWMMFLVLALADAIAWVRPRGVRLALCGAAVCTAVLTLATAVPAYYRLAYPADVLYRFGVNTALLPAGRMRCELDPVYSYASPAPLNRRTGYPYQKRADYLLINFCQGTPAPRARTAAPIDRRATLLYRAPHFMTFPAYGFEGLSPGDRRSMRERAYDVIVYALRPD
jgi:hypothetical protein